MFPESRKEVLPWKTVELINNTNVYLSDLYSLGIIKGDEIMVINGAIVSDLDMMYIESVLQVGSILLADITNHLSGTTGASNIIDDFFC